MFNKKKKIFKGSKARESPEVEEARKYIEDLHSSYSILGEEEPFHYVKTSEKGEFKRYHFYKGRDKRITYVVLCEQERNEIIKKFKERMGEKGNLYAYQDTILIGINNFQHRFRSLKSFMASLTFMGDDGDIAGGNFSADEEIFE